MAKLTSTPTSLPARPTAPTRMPAAARRLWRSVVLEYPARHFSAANRALLEGFCRAWAHAVDCDELIAARGLLIDDKPNPACALRAAAWRELRAFATKLRLPISSLQRADSALARPDERHSLLKPWERS